MREARKLKSTHEHIELLKEKLLEEKGRKERAESELSKLQEVQLSMKRLDDELSTWKLLLKDIPDVSCSEDIPVKFAALQRFVSSFMSDLMAKKKKKSPNCFSFYLEKVRKIAILIPNLVIGTEYIPCHSQYHWLLFSCWKLSLVWIHFIFF